MNSRNAPRNLHPSRRESAVRASSSRRRAFFFTLDALAALLVSSLIVLGLLQILTAIPAPATSTGARIASDFLDALDANATLRAAVFGCQGSNPSTLLTAMEALPSNMCAELNVNNQQCLIRSARCSCGSNPRAQAYRVFSQTSGNTQTDLLVGLTVCNPSGGLP